MDSDSVPTDLNPELAYFDSGLKEWGPKLMKSDAELMRTLFRSRGKEENIFFQISHYVRKSPNNIKEDKIKVKIRNCKRYIGNKEKAKYVCTVN